MTTDVSVTRFGELVIYNDEREGNSGATPFFSYLSSNTVLYALVAPSSRR